MPLAWPPIVSDPWSDPVSWDTILVSGKPWGTGTLVGGGILVRGATRFYRIDQKDAKGQEGSTQTYLGTRPKPFKLVFRMWTTKQFQYFNTQILPLFFYTGNFSSGQQVYTIPIAHPQCAMCNIASVLTDEIGPIEVDEHTKMLHFTIGVREYYPAQPGNASTTPTAPNPNAGTGKPGYAPPVKIQINQLTIEQLQRQAGLGPGNWTP